VLTAYIYQFS